MNRVCIKCGETKAEDEFKKNVTLGYIGNTCKKCVNKYRQIRRKTGLEKRETKGKWKWSHNSEERKLRVGQSRDKYRKQHPELDKVRKDKARKELKDYYVLRQLRKRTKLNTERLRTYPELIESYRMQLRVKRLIKSKHEGIEANQPERRL